MLILSDCFTDKVDEGCLKVANSLARRIKEVCPHTVIASYERHPDWADVQLSLNKFFLNRSLISLIRKQDQPILYIPFASNTTASILRTWVLSIFSRKRVIVLFALRHPMNGLAKWLLKKSRAQIIALSAQSYEYYQDVVGNLVHYIKTGIDTTKFTPVSSAEKNRLREKYNIPREKTVVLHVGHLKDGRNIEDMLELSQDHHIVLVISSVTKDQRDLELQQKFESRGNVTILDGYLPNIEEVYQMADAYVFPVRTKENCIDIPLSVLEAASCGIPVVTTPYGELRQMQGKTGFSFMERMDIQELSAVVADAIKHNTNAGREAVLAYDWQESIKKIQQMADKE